MLLMPLLLALCRTDFVTSSDDLFGVSGQVAGAIHEEQHAQSSILSGMVST